MYLFNKLLSDFSYLRTKSLQRNKYKGEHSPVFIIGSGRSGTTLIRKLLVTQFQFNIPPESGMLMINIMKKEYLRFSMSRSRYINLIIDLVKKDNDIKFWDLDFQIYRALISKTDLTATELIESLYETYAVQNDQSHNLWGDKTPYLTLYLKWISLFFPNSKYIHIHRNPLQVIDSRMKNLNETFEIASKRWFWAIKEISREKNKGNLIKILEIKLEEYISDQENYIKQIGEFLGLTPSREVKMSKKGDLLLPHMQKINQPINHKKVMTAELSVDQINHVRQLQKSLDPVYAYPI